MAADRRRFLAALLASTTAAAIGCRNGGNFSVLGYTTEPPFDPNIRSVYVPTFKLMPVVTTPLRNLDVELTDAVVKELTARKTPIKVVSDPSRADTELIGTILSVTKPVLNRNLQALPLESELVITLDVVWRDLRTGEILSNPKIAKRANPPAEVFDPGLQPPAPPDPNANFPTVTPVRIT
ncbi:MAG: LPS assembly lipoprotein LptE, partial [Fimbriiglobus sp.]|nr:LPS assembly lipoprotein LptE [Fimbriiglobus sp.]